MLYFKHSELVNRYGVSLKTVHNWMNASKRGNLSLELHLQGSRTYIANSPENVATLLRLAEEGKKYRNSRHHKVVSPSDEFYKLYSRRQIADIISNIETHGEIPRQYNYFGEGAAHWDRRLQYHEKESSHQNLLQGTIELIDSNLKSIDALLSEYKKVNIIDLGVGNGRTVKELLAHLIDNGKLHRYIGVDISPTMLHIAERNLKSWLGDDIPFEGHIRDITHERFDDLLTDDRLSGDSAEIANFVLCFGATLINFRDYENVLNFIRTSMRENDFLAYTDVRDTRESRRRVSFLFDSKSNGLSPSHSYILDLMNIDESFYDSEAGFDPAERMRYVRIRLKVDLTIKFQFEGNERSVSLEKGNTILLLRVYYLSTFEMIAKFDSAGLALLQSSLTKNRQSFLSISNADIKGTLSS